MGNKGKVKVLSAIKIQLLLQIDINLGGQQLHKNYFRQAGAEMCQAQAKIGLSLSLVYIFVVELKVGTIFHLARGVLLSIGVPRGLLPPLLLLPLQ